MAHSKMLGIIMVLALYSHDCDTVSVLYRGDSLYVIGVGRSSAGVGVQPGSLGAMTLEDLYWSAYPNSVGACLKIMIVTVYSALISKLLYQLPCVVVSVTIQTTRAGL